MSRIGIQGAKEGQLDILGKSPFWRAAWILDSR